MLVASVAGPTSQIAFGDWSLTSFSKRDRHLVRKGHVELAGDKGEDRRRAVRNDREVDAVEIGQPRLPVIRVADQLDVLVGLVFDELEGAGADRMLAHLGRGDVAGIDRRLAGGEQQQKRRLRPLQMENRLVVALGGHVRQIEVPGPAVVDPELVLALVEQQVPGAFDVGGGERLAVMPFDALAQLEREFGAVFAPRPARRQFRHDRFEAVLRVRAGRTAPGC